jgi:hypothetical protein
MHNLFAATHAQKQNYVWNSNKFSICENIHEI